MKVCISLCVFTVLVMTRSLKHRAAATFYISKKMDHTSVGW